jgi:hypothetical protein
MRSSTAVAKTGKADDVSNFEASAPALGYIYQIRYALVLAVEAWLKGATDWQIGVETADDVEVIDSDGRRLVQLKHVQDALSNGSEGFWKSIRIWAVLVTGEVGNTSTQYLLVSTAGALGNSAPYFLQPEDTGHRNPEEALRLMEQFMSQSISRSLKKSFEAFGRLTSEQRLDLLNNVVVLTDQPDVVAFGERLQDSVALGLGKRHGQAFIESLEGWWYELIIGILQADVDSRPMVTAEKFDAFVTNLQEDLVGGWLPIDEALLQTEQDPSDYSHYVFVRQLNLIDAGSQTIFRAVRDYYRAFTHRSEWQRLQLIGGADVARYERRLIEAWETRFDHMREDLGEEGAEQGMKELARRLYRWIETGDHPLIRERVDEPFVAVGSYQMLAEVQQVGWHPEFSARLACLLEPASR